jgi:hypothetical protein
MFNHNKLAIITFVIIAMTSIAVSVFAQDQPSSYIINMIVTRLIMQDPSIIDTHQISDLKITKESRSNGRYYIEVSYNRISDKGKIYPEHGKFFIEKKGSIWIGGNDKSTP